jgi:hypothetical protein
MEITTIHKASDLPESWDELAEDYFQTRVFLDHTEKYNPCNQRYYLLSENGFLQTVAVIYTLKLNLLTYLSLKSAFRVNIAGIPCSVSASGLFGNRIFFGQLLKCIVFSEKGFLLALNVESPVEKGMIVSGRTLPTIVLTNRFSSWDDYLASLRAPYRRRIRLFSSSFGVVRKKHLACSSFDETMYRQYLEVLRRSKGKLETLTMNFFQQLPPEFRLTALYHDEIPAGWYITVTFREKLYFFLGGVDYTLNRSFNTYFNILAEIIKEGIEKKVSLTDLGQTAEIPKLKLGGKLVEKNMLATHSNGFIRHCLNAGKSFLEYRSKWSEFHVLKELS